MGYLGTSSAEHKERDPGLEGGGDVSDEYLPRMLPLRSTPLALVSSFKPLIWLDAYHSRKAWTHHSFGHQLGQPPQHRITSQNESIYR